jgi:hypothetical protein
MLANFAFEGLPIHADKVRKFFLVKFGRQPIFETIVMNEAY